MSTAGGRWSIGAAAAALLLGACASRAPAAALRASAPPTAPRAAAPARPVPVLATRIARPNAAAKKESAAAPPAPVATPAQALARPMRHLPAISIIIDDLGEQYAGGLRALALPGAVAYAFLPLTPHAREQASAAHRAGREVLLHLPLEPTTGTRLMPVSISRGSNLDELVDRVSRSLASVPFASGVNNHQGSVLTQSRAHMDWLMTELRAHGGLYFVDSRTSARSIAYDVARARGVPAAARNVFLDDVPDEALVRSQWAHLLQVARQRGSALAIGHPHAVTLKVLEEELPRLAASGVRLVAPSELIRLQGGDAPARPRLQLSPALMQSTIASRPAQR